MKSFGVRIAAGAITLMFGAYAAVLAQKDKQDETTTWTAELPSLGEPAEPIAADAWANQPPSEAQNSALTMGAVQLVQHSEPIDDTSTEADTGPSFDPSALPEGLSDGSNQQTTGMAVPDWTFAAQPTGTEDDTPFESQPSFSMTLPASTGGTAAAEAQPASNSAEMTFGQMPTFAANPSAPEAAASSASVIASGSGFGVPQPNGQVAVSGDDSGMFPNNSLRDSSTAGLDAAAASAAGQPMVNGLAYESQGPTSAEPQHSSAAGLAQNAPGFGQSAQQFDRPTTLSGASTAGLGAPQTGGFEQPGGAATFSGAEPFNPYIGSQQNSDPPPRMASLGEGGLPGYDVESPRFNSGQPQALTQPETAVELDPATAIDHPGDRHLEGAQTPSIIIQKRAPREVKVGKPATFVIHVQNVGSAEALSVKIHDRIPSGMRLIDASPTPTQRAGLLYWELGAMPAGDQRTVTMQLVPEQEGELGSVARVSFEAAASVRTISTKPELQIIQRAPESVLIGQQLEIELEVSNPGTGAATGVMLLEDVPEGLEHPKGRRLDNSIGTLAPGEVRRQVLRLRAAAPGLIQNTIRLTGDDGLQATHTVAVQVIAPELTVELDGPSRRFLERQATYQLNIANTGTADATNVEIAVQLDRGFTFVSTDYQGQYDPSRHAVYWSLAQLPAGANGKVPLTLLPVEEGEQAIVIDARADLGVVAKSERKMTVEGFAELSFAIRSEGGPIELGSETVYEIQVTNSGSKPDSNVRVQLQLPEGLKLISADNRAGTNGRGLVVFEPKPQIAPGEEQVYRIRLQGISPGTQIVRAVVVSDQSTVPVTKEESTLVYSDQ